MLVQIFSSHPTVLIWSTFITILSLFPGKKAKIFFSIRQSTKQTTDHSGFCRCQVHLRPVLSLLSKLRIEVNTTVAPWLTRAWLPMHKLQPWKGINIKSYSYLYIPPVLFYRCVT